MKRLTVLFMGEPVGILAQSRVGKMSFRYDPAWLGKEGSRPLSQSLPLQPEMFNEKACAPFFDGLLPEEHNREVIARNIGVSPRNDFALLRAVGGECAGAVSLTLDERPPVPVTDQYKTISETELIDLLDQLPERPLLAGEPEVRLSLAGAQNKLALRVGPEGYAIPQLEAPSTHLIKPEPARFLGLADNEAHCLKLAAALGLEVCEAEVRQFGPHRCLLVARYDRMLRGDAVERLHQEDFCQALAVPSRIKYQSEGGPGLGACFELVRRVSARPAKDLLQLFHVVLFNYLIGNHDAHAKNYALLYAPFHEPEAVRLAPFYDLISTALYPALTKKMAMKIGASYDAENLGLRDWERYWKRIGFSLNQARRQSLEFVDLLTEQCASPRNEVETRIQGVIVRRSTRLRNLLS